MNPTDTIKLLNKLITDIPCRKSLNKLCRYFTLKWSSGGESVTPYFLSMGCI